MLSGVTSIACAIVGTAVLRMVVSSDCMKKATATSHGSSRLVVSVGAGGGAVAVVVIRWTASLWRRAAGRANRRQRWRATSSSAWMRFTISCSLGSLTSVA